MLDQKDLEVLKTMMTDVVKQSENKMLQKMDERITASENKMLQKMDERITASENKMLQKMDERITASENKMLQKMDDSITDVKLHLENVTDKNIRIVAEGHLDLNRKLDEALKIQNEKEILQIRLNYLEGEIATVKNRLAQLEQTA